MLLYFSNQALQVLFLYEMHLIINYYNQVYIDDWSKIMKSHKNTLPSVFTANFFFLIIIILLIIKDYLFNLIDFNNFYYSVLISEYGLYLIPIILYLMFNGFNLKHTLRLNKLSFKQIIIISLIAICVACISTFLNTIIPAILSLFGSFPRISQQIPSPNSINQLITLLFFVALTPAICEETLFRGLIMRCYEQLGGKAAIMASGILFGIFHFSVNIQGLLGLSFMGIILAYLVFKTNSIFASMLAHFVYNSFGNTLRYFANSSTDTTVQIINSKVAITTLLSSAIFAIPAAILCFILLRLLTKSTINDTYINNIEQRKNYIKSNIVRYAPLLPIILLYIYSCIRPFLWQ